MAIAISKAMLDLRLVIREKQVSWVCIAHPKHIWHPNLLREYPDFTSHCVKVVSNQKFVCTLRLSLLAKCVVVRLLKPCAPQHSLPGVNLTRVTRKRRKAQKRQQGTVECVAWRNKKKFAYCARFVTFASKTWREHESQCCCMSSPAESKVITADCDISVFCSKVRRLSNPPWKFC